jgi:hypothetical protein
MISAALDGPSRDVSQQIVVQVVGDIFVEPENAAAD